MFVNDKCFGLELFQIFFVLSISFQLNFFDSNRVEYINDEMASLILTTRTKSTSFSNALRFSLRNMKVEYFIILLGLFSHLYLINMLRIIVIGVEQSALMIGVFHLVHGILTDHFPSKMELEYTSCPLLRLLLVYQFERRYRYISAQLDRYSLTSLPPLHTRSVQVALRISICAQDVSIGR